MCFMNSHTVQYRHMYCTQNRHMWFLQRHVHSPNNKLIEDRISYFQNLYIIIMTQVCHDYEARPRNYEVVSLQL